jgi:hypothetical protein
VALREGLVRAESDREYYAELVVACAARPHPFTPEREQARWGRLPENIQATGTV